MEGKEKKPGSKCAVKYCSNSYSAVTSYFSFPKPEDSVRYYNNLEFF